MSKPAVRYSLIVGGLRERLWVFHWLEGVGGMLGYSLPILSTILVTSWSDGFSENAHRPTQEPREVVSCRPSLRLVYAWRFM